MANIIVPPEHLMEYFIDEFELLNECLVPIAVGDDEPIVIYLSAEHDRPFFQIEYGGRCVFEMETESSADAEEMYRSFLATYFDEDDDPTDFNRQQLERLEDVTSAVEDLVRILIQTNPEDEGMLDVDYLTFADMIGQELQRKYGFSIYLPLIVEQSGEQVVVDYPYSEEVEEGGDDA